MRLWVDLTFFLSTAIFLNRLENVTILLKLRADCAGCRPEDIEGNHSISLTDTRSTCLDLVFLLRKAYKSTKVFNFVVKFPLLMDLN
jgi:hypothetical protein